ncbi:MAG: hypothetical protein F6K39_03770 [Okeania sp. SIO3B3]|nr:hypothetical protein [Okeania sp. SIO3B3]
MPLYIKSFIKWLGTSFILPCYTLLGAQKRYKVLKALISRANLPEEYQVECNRLFASQITSSSPEVLRQSAGQIPCSQKERLAQLALTDTQLFEDYLPEHYLPEVLAGILPSHMNEVVSTLHKHTYRYTTQGKMQVVLGAGGEGLEGWKNTDIDQLDIRDGLSWSRLFYPASLDNLLAEHVLEHLTLEEALTAFQHIYSYMRQGGVFRIAVPDAYHPSLYYRELVKPGGLETPFEHKAFLDYKVLTMLAHKSGFVVNLLEYFDENGNFHQKDYSEESGVIRRCAKNNIGLDSSNNDVMHKFYSSIPKPLRQQFCERKMTYTSLIADLIKR